MKCKLGMFASSGWKRLTRLVLSVDGGMGRNHRTRGHSGSLQLSKLISVCDISGYFLHGRRQGMFRSPHPSAWLKCSLHHNSLCQFVFISFNLACPPLWFLMWYSKMCIRTGVKWTEGLENQVEAGKTKNRWEFRKERMWSQEAGRSPLQLLLIRAVLEGLHHDLTWGNTRHWAALVCILHLLLIYDNDSTHSVSIPPPILTLSFVFRLLLYPLVKFQNEPFPPALYVQFPSPALFLMPLLLYATWWSTKPFYV